LVTLPVAAASGFEVLFVSPSATTGLPIVRRQTRNL